jgi:hypothetical protein
MYATQFVSDAAAFAPQPSRGGLGHQPNDEKPAARRKASLLASLRGRLASHAPAQPSPSHG